MARAADPLREEAGPNTWGYDIPHDAGESAETWVVEGRIDLRDDANPEGPLVMLERIGA